MSPGEMVAKQADKAQQQEKPSVAVANEMNPILDAFRTLATFVAAKSQQGDPNAGEMQALLANFVKLIQGGAGTPADGSQMAPPVPELQAEAKGPNMMGQVKMGNPMLGKMSAGAKAQSGRIAVI